jgi:hypothetical protein
MKLKLNVPHVSAMFCHFQANVRWCESTYYENVPVKYDTSLFTFIRLPSLCGVYAVCVILYGPMSIGVCGFSSL